MHLAFIDGHPLHRGAEEAQRALAAIGALLSAFPGDMQACFQLDMMDWFRGLAQRLRALGEEGNRCCVVRRGGSGRCSVVQSDGDNLGWRQ